jgi:hypothetical protein
MGPYEASVELERVARALDEAQLLVAGLDRVIASMDLIGEPRYSPLRTLIETAQASLTHVVAHLRTEEKPRPT